MTSDQRFEEQSMLAIAAHELRGPLTVLTLQLSRLIEDDHRDHPGIQKMFSEVRRMTGIVDNYLVASQLDGCPFCLAVDSLELEPVLSSVADRTEVWAGDRPEVMVESGLRCWGDAERLEQVLWNLFQHAYQHGADPVQVAGWADGPEARIIVADCGEGIPESLRPSVTRMFQRGHAHSGGLGVGLGLSKTIIEAHGGRFWIESAPCGGAAIHIALDRAGGL